MRQLLKRLLYPSLSRWYKRRSRRAHNYTKYGISLTVFPGVFHPGMFFSTGILIGMLQQMTLGNKRVLELGAGSGLIAFYAWKKGAIVTASDVSEQSLKGLRANADTLKAAVSVVRSNLFENLSPQDFDLIIINPPYYPENPKNQEDAAFYCGGNFEYFRQLFSQLSGKVTADIRMILSEDCDFHAIASIARQNGLQLAPVYRKTVWFEKNTVYVVKTLS